MADSPALALDKLVAEVDNPAPELGKPAEDKLAAHLLLLDNLLVDAEEDTSEQDILAAAAAVQKEMEDTAILLLQVDKASLLALRDKESRPAAGNLG